MSSPNTNVDGKRSNDTGAKRRFTLAGAAALVMTSIALAHVNQDASASPGSSAASIAPDTPFAASLSSSFKHAAKDGIRLRVQRGASKLFMVLKPGRG